MAFALLIAAILWNLGTWSLGLPASSSHTLIGSIVGVGVANALMHGRNGTSGVDWSQVTKIGESLLLSPLVGFAAAGLLLWVLRIVIKNRQLFDAPKSNAPPPWWIRGVLVLTCTGVSFAHGSNDGQKGMGPLMLGRFRVAGLCVESRHARRAGRPIRGGSPSHSAVAGQESVGPGADRARGAVARDPVGLRAYAAVPA